MESYSFDHILFNSLSVFVFIILFIVFLRIKQKEQLHYLFLWNNSFLLIWIFFRYVEELVFSLTGDNSIILISLFNIGANFIPLSIFLSCVAYVKERIKINAYYYLLFIPPLVSLFFAFTNNLYGFYYIKYTSFLNNNLYGWAYYFHIIYSYIYVSLGLYIVIRNTRNLKFISKQTLILIMGISIPSLLYFLITFKVINLPLYSESLCFALGAVFILFAVLKHNFLDVFPVALNSIFDNISDSFVVIDYKYTILEVNQTFKNEFEFYLDENSNLLEIINVGPLLKIKEILLDAINKSLYEKSKEILEIYVNDKFYKLEVTPVFTERMIIIVLLFKDITEDKQLIERERLSSIIQMIGGIAHNLKTPLMSSGAGIQIIKRDIDKIKHNLYNDSSIDSFDAQIDEISDWLTRIKLSLSYMSDVITAIKDQVVSKEENKTFSVKEVIDRILLLMSYEFIKSKCILKKEIGDEQVKIHGDMNSMIQVINNLITNAIEASEGEEKQVILGTTTENNSLLFYVRNIGRPIEDSIKENLFIKMITTKGKDGTGLGLYISNIIIKSKFKGEIYFESSGRETIFYVKIPIERI